MSGRLGFGALSFELSFLDILFIAFEIIDEGGQNGPES
jgi:hypothetical protein